MTGQRVAVRGPVPEHAGLVNRPERPIRRERQGRDVTFGMEPRLAEWSTIRRRWDPDGRLRSAQSVRILGDTP